MLSTLKSSGETSLSSGPKRRLLTCWRSGARTIVTDLTPKCITCAFISCIFLSLTLSYSIIHRIGWADMLVFLNYGEQFTKIRRLSQQPFNRKESENFREIQMRQTHILLHNFLRTPLEYYKHTLRYIHFVSFRYPIPDIVGDRS